MDHLCPPSPAWTRGRLLGSGSFGRVHLAHHTSSGECFAVKSVSLPSQEASAISAAVSAAAAPAEPQQPPRTSANSCLEALENEIAFLSQIDCPQIVSFRGSDWTREGDRAVRNLHVEIMPGGTVAGLLAGNGGAAGLEPATVRSYTRDVTRGLAHIHARNIVHGDIKGLNLLLAANDTVKIADFGSAFRAASASATIQVEGASIEDARRRVRGTASWMAPEVARGEEQSTSADIWSLGCTVLEMITGRPTWNHVTGGMAAVLYQIGCTDELPQVPETLIGGARAFIACCLRRDASMRWTAEQLLQHPFLRQTGGSDNDDRVYPAAVAQAGTSRKKPFMKLGAFPHRATMTTCDSSLAPLSPTTPLDAFALSNCSSPAPSPLGPSASRKRLLSALGAEREGGETCAGGEQRTTKKQCVGAAAAVGWALNDVAIDSLCRQSCGDESGAQSDMDIGTFQWPQPMLCPLPSAVQWIVVHAVKPIV